MIIKKHWTTVTKYLSSPFCTVVGWYLFGFIPLYVRKTYHQTFQR